MSFWRGSELLALETDVDVWHYTVLVVHARNEWMNDRGTALSVADMNELACQTECDVTYVCLICSANAEQLLVAVQTVLPCVWSAEYFANNERRC